MKALALSALLLSTAPPRMGASTVGDRVEGRTPLHLSIVLAPRDMEALRALIASQRDPRSPNFRRFLTPAAFGEGFGQPKALYDLAVSWIASGGFAVERFPSRLFIGATGTAAQAEALLGVQLHNAIDARGQSFRQPTGPPAFPLAIAPFVLTVDGLDTRSRLHPRLQDSSGNQDLGPQDLRRFYDIDPLLARGITGRTAQLAVLGPQVPPDQMPSPDEMSFFLENLSNSTATVIMDILPNPGNDLSTVPGWHTELEADVELETVAAPGATSITLVLSPGGEVYTAGVNEIVNNLSRVTAVSTSIGICEPDVLAQDGGIVPSAVEALIAQGVAEGQTWFGTSGDNGVDACGDGSGPAVDFPGSLPEIVACGGTQAPLPFDSNNAIAGYVPEVVWNSTYLSGAGGGGSSILFSKPSWQAAVSPNDGGRDLPDIAFESGNWIAVANGPSVGVVGQFAGTSAAAPLAAGIFALISESVGCRLGLIQPDLYELGQNQFDGGAVVFHDVITGNNSFDSVTGFEATVGFDLASGWGSLDVAALAAAWPPCPASGGFSLPDAGPLTPYDRCPACDAGLYCEAAGEGPAACVPPCAASGGDGGGHCLAACSVDAGNCKVGRSCQPLAGGVYLCLPSCHVDFDCGILPGSECSADAGVCVPLPAKVGGTGGGAGGTSGSGIDRTANGVGCGCGSGAAFPEDLATVASLLLVRRRSRGRRASSRK